VRELPTPSPFKVKSDPARDAIGNIVHIDSPTLITYSAALIAVLGGSFVFFWSREKRSALLVRFSLPFLCGACGAALLTRPGLVTGDWQLRLGAWFILAAYGFIWQAVRALYARRFLLLWVVIPVSLWLVLLVSVFTEWHLLAMSAAMRAVLVAGFNGLSAFEFWRSREEDLPSRRVLFWVFAIYCLFDTVRVAFVTVLPMPLGSTPTEPWAVAFFNLAALTLGLLSCIFMIALSLERASMENYQMALRDVMTNVYNRRAYVEHMQTMVSGTPALPYALLVFDIDRFKSINDRFGHALGDKVIIRAAQAAEASLRRLDKVFRIGGEEFACVLPDTAQEDAYDAAERIRLGFEAIASSVDGKPIFATLSVGIALSGSHAERPEQIFARADQALYEAKQSGRNRSVLAK
jgi:diguanylate cyclase (GGDEF)-like protein